jgi:hypothetical protein
MKESSTQDATTTGPRFYVSAIGGEHDATTRVLIYESDGVTYRPDSDRIEIERVVPRSDALDTLRGFRRLCDGLNR